MALFSSTQTVAEVAALVQEGLQFSSHALREVLQLGSAQNLMFPRFAASKLVYCEGLNVICCWKGTGVDMDVVGVSATIASPIMIHAGVDVDNATDMPDCCTLTTLYSAVA